MNIIRNDLNKLYPREINGVYYPHQPIYGQRPKAYPKSNQPLSYQIVPKNFVIVWNILKELKKLNFNSILDVGGSEGYTAYRIKQLFGVCVESSDYSDIACKRARDIFNIPAQQADARNLHYKDESFDVVICSETLEHMYEYDTAFKELIRVARKAVIITVPYQSKKNLEKHRLEGSGHRSHFDKKSFGRGRLISSRFTRLIGRFTNNPNIMLLDKFLPLKDTLIFVIHKHSLTPRWVVDFKVPHHIIKSKGGEKA